jgi:hypothetical protein
MNKYKYDLDDELEENKKVNKFSSHFKNDDPDSSI